MDGELRFCLSCDINVPVTFRVQALEGNLRLPPRPGELQLWDQAPIPKLYVECALYIDGELFGLPTRTSLAPIERPHKWNELVTLSAKYRDLPATAQLVLTVWDVSYPRLEVAVGGASLRLFGSKKQLKTGKQKLRLWRGRVADGSVVSSTPGKVPKNERGELERLEKLQNKYERGQIERISWLDSLALKSIDKIKDAESKRGLGDNLYLTVELRAFAHLVVFQEVGLLQPAATSENELVAVGDPEVCRQNSCENKQFKLARSMTRGVIDQDLKPSNTEKKAILQVLKYPPTRNLTGEERQLLWKFRFYLRSERKALTKFLRCVDWSDAQEAKQAIELMRKWESIDIPDALELLSPAFESEEVRAHAVEVLKEKTTSEELQCYLLQLVQALRYERSDDSHLAGFLVERATTNMELASFFRWYVTMELADPAFTRRYYFVYEQFEQTLKSTPEGQQVWTQIIRETEMVAKLTCMAKDVKNVRGSSQKKIDKLRFLLSGMGVMNELTSFEPLPLPLDPKISVTGIVVSDSTVFKSAQSPLRITFRTLDGGKCKIIFKRGDDLRQDQLVIQLVTLMDKLLKLENLDLQLTPYRVLATTQDEGMLEYIPSKSLAQVLAEHRTLLSYFRQYHADAEGPFGISAPCLETFVKSCAGYCVIMYILGVGDRHLDNLLLREDGRLFHVDFGYMLGRDPKPFPPPMKLCKEMVEAMGGTDSEYYVKFKSYCCEAYNILRKSSNLILNLFYLMAGANIPDISADPEKGILKLQEKFRLDLNDEEAVQFIQTLINDSVSALFPQMVETIHRWAQYWR